MNYAKAIRTLRGSRGLQQKDLASRLGLDPSYVSLLERGKRTPSTEVLQSLAEVFAVPVYLVMLLASEENDLRGVDPRFAGELSKHALNAILDVELRSNKRR